MEANKILYMLLATLVVFAVNYAKKSFKQTLEADRLIDVLRDSNEKQESEESLLNCLEHSLL